MLYTQNCTKAAIIKMLLDPNYYYEIRKKLPTNLKKEFNVSNLKQEQQNHFFSNQFDFDSLETRPITSTNDRDKLWAAATEEAIISDRRFPQIDDNRADNPPVPKSPEKDHPQHMKKPDPPILNPLQFGPNEQSIQPNSATDPPPQPPMGSFKFNTDGPNISHKLNSFPMVPALKPNPTSASHMPEVSLVVDERKMKNFSHNKIITKQTSSLELSAYNNRKMHNYALSHDYIPVNANTDLDRLYKYLARMACQRYVSSRTRHCVTTTTYFDSNGKAVPATVLSDTGGDLSFLSAKFYEGNCFIRGPDCHLTLHTTNATTKNTYGTVFLTSLYQNDSSKSASVLSLVTPKLGKITGYDEQITEDIISDFCIDGPIASQLRAQTILAGKEIDVLGGLDCANMLMETITADDLGIFHSPLHPHLSFWAQSL